MGRWLGVDLGQVRVGLALSDPAARLAMPLETWQRSGQDDVALAGQIAQIVALHQVERVVVGLPLGLKGQEGPAAQAVKAFSEQLGLALGPGVPVMMQDERGTTIQAHQLLHSAGRKAKKHRPVVDQVAAVVILQAALDHELIMCVSHKEEGGDPRHGSMGSVR